MEKNSRPAISKTTIDFRPPIVVVLGHVDHGKTTLLDTIRKTQVTAQEAGGITQHIGAYQVTVSPKGKPSSRATEGNRGITSERVKPDSNGILRQAQDDRAGETRAITFIDTPGHEAFAKMRSRGAKVADIALLVVAATDGVMPQTQESIKYIKAADISVIVVINKIDLPHADPQKVKQQLASFGVLVEGFGGDVVALPVSAKTGKGIPELLDVILLVAELKGVSGAISAPFEGVMIEAKLDKKRGSLTTILVKNGMLKVGDTIFAETEAAKVRAMMNDRGETIQEAPPGTPVEIMGWKEVPPVGATISKIRPVAFRSFPAPTQRPFTLPPLTELKKLKLIVKTDVVGSLEAIKENIGDLVEIVQAGASEIIESDVLTAKHVGAVIVGFNVEPSTHVVKLAKIENVKIKTYTIIYELLDEIKEVAKMLNEPDAQEDLLGEAEIRAEFPFNGQKIAGGKVIHGRIARGDTIRIVREDREIGKTRIKSIRHGKEDISKAEIGQECGMLFERQLDFRVGDRIIAYKVRDLLA